MSDHFKRTYFVLDTRGVVHRVKTATIGDLRALDAFRRQSVIHGYEAKDQPLVEHEIKTKSPASAIGLEIKHDIQYAFPDASGAFMDHATARDFFWAVGYVSKVKTLCKSRLRKFEDDVIRPDGSIAYLDEAPYRVELPGITF